MAYFIETELEAKMCRSFGTTTPITSTQIGTLATAISNMWDGLNEQAAGTEGDNTTCAQHVKEACLAAASYIVGQRYLGEEYDEREVLTIMKNYMRGGDKPRSVFHVDSPDSGGNW